MLLPRLAVPACPRLAWLLPVPAVISEPCRLARPACWALWPVNPQVFEASGSLVAATWEKAAVVVPPGASFEEYLDMELPADAVQVCAVVCVSVCEGGCEA